MFGLGHGLLFRDSDFRVRILREEERAAFNRDFRTCDYEFLPGYKCQHQRMYDCNFKTLVGWGVTIPNPQLYCRKHAEKFLEENKEKGALYAIA